MIEYDDFKRLKSYECSVGLFNDFILSSNRYHQIFISRGGKKRYYLTDNFIKLFFIKE